MPKHVLKVDEENHLSRLDVFLVKALTEVSSRSYIQKLIENSLVTVNGKIVKSRYKVHQGDEIIVNWTKPPRDDDDIKAEKIALDIFYEDDQIVVINKPIGMLVHPAQNIYTGTLVNALKYLYEDLSDINTDLRPGIIHRLDKETSGLMVVAKDNTTHLNLARQFEKHLIKKHYVALVEGLIEFDEGIIDAPLGRHPRHREKKAVLFDDLAKEARTIYRVIKRGNNITFVSLFPQTGRTHQLRVHMAYLGHPILGDDKYGKKKLFPRLALHAQAIGFIHPKTNHYVEFSSQIPAEFFNAVRS